MTPIQSRMARAALGWRVADLATNAKIGSATAARFELGQPVAGESLARIAAAYEAAGVILIAADAKGGPGARLARA